MHDLYLKGRTNCPLYDVILNKTVQYLIYIGINLIKTKIGIDKFHFLKNATLSDC